MTACNLGNAALFDDPDRTDEARDLCKRHCNRLIECRAYALRTDVAGMCGGLTEQERHQWRTAYGVTLIPHEAVEATTRRLRDACALQYVAGGLEVTRVAERFGVSPQTLYRAARAQVSA